MEESVGEWGPGLLDALSRIEDPRKPKGVRHPLPAILALSVCAMLSGARSLYAIAQWGREHPQFAQSLGFSREQTPCVATLHHVFRRLDADAFESAWAAGRRNAWERARPPLPSTARHCGEYTVGNCLE